MPLPKSASVAARATDVYSDVCPLVLASSSQPENSELSTLLPYLRQLLTCCACAGLLQDAMVSLSCGHCYCEQCQYGSPLLKIQCRQCRERTGLVINTQLRTVVQLYKELLHVLRLTSTKLVSLTPFKELIKEITDGIKVSPVILMIRPPERYMTGKPVTPKKEPVRPEQSVITSSPSSPSRLHEIKTITKVVKHDVKFSIVQPSNQPCPTSIKSEDLSDGCYNLEVEGTCLTVPLKTEKHNHFDFSVTTKPQYKIPFNLSKQSRSPFTPRLYTKNQIKALKRLSKKKNRLHCVVSNLVKALQHQPLVTTPQSSLTTSTSHSSLSTSISHSSLSTSTSHPPSSHSSTIECLDQPTPLKKVKRKSKKQKYICTLSNEEIEELKKEPKFRCRCGTNPGVLHEHLICAKKKCPCFLNGLPCSRCRCRGCCNPYNYVLNC